MPYAVDDQNFDAADARNLIRAAGSRFDENLALIVKEIMDETLVNLDWWAGQLWWFVPNGLVATPWQFHPTAPASLKRLSNIAHELNFETPPSSFFHEPTLMKVDEATWLPSAKVLKAAGVRFLVILDIIAEDRPSARLIFIVQTGHSLGTDERQFLKATSLLLPKMVVRERARTDLQFRATHDPLTGLLNRLGLHQQLNLVPLAKKNLRAVLFIDINNFKQVNDQYGHEIGDELLIYIAGQLSAQIRPTDALARIGGDEFVVVAGEVALPEAAEIFANRLWAAVAEPFVLSNGTSWQGAASIGVALWLPGETYATALRLADMQMYRAKKHDGGVAMQSPTAQPQAAISSGGLLEIHPIMSLLNYEVQGLQVTVQTDLRLPDSLQLGAMVSSQLQSRLLGASHDIWLRLPKSFWLDSDRISELLEVIYQQIQKPQINLVMSCATMSFESRLAAKELVDRFKVGIVLEDFGSGNRDLELLQELEPVALVIDSAAVIPEELNEEVMGVFDWAVPRSVIAIADVLGITAVAPAGANAAQLKSFENLGCKLWLQGS